MKTFNDSDFAVVFRGEMPSARVIHGWGSVLAYLDLEATKQSPEESYCDPANTGLHDIDNWLLLENCYRDNGGDERFQFSEDIGECDSVTITRLTHD